MHSQTNMSIRTKMSIHAPTKRIPYILYGSNRHTRVLYTRYRIAPKHPISGITTLYIHSRQSHSHIVTCTLIAYTVHTRHKKTQQHKKNENSKVKRFLGVSVLILKYLQMCGKDVLLCNEKLTVLYVHLNTNIFLLCVSY